MLCPDPPDLDPLKRTLFDFLIGAGALLALQFIFPRTSAHLSSRVCSKFARLARKPVFTATLLFLTVIVARVALLRRFPVPVPGIHDESSYLLMADTFAHGRLSNPPHAMWMSLETFHINWFPRYASMYPPAQGLVLALGQLLGSPWIGVVLGAAAMVAAIYWMLTAWVPRSWAFLGGIIAWLKFCIASYWINSYWGGSVAATGGALLLGSFARIIAKPTAVKSKIRQPRTRDALLLALGLAILANSRPYEGFLFSLPAGIYLLVWLFRRATRMEISQRSNRIALPILAILALTAAAMAFYNRSLTGGALLFPESLNVRTYHTAPMFVFQSAKPPLHYHNQQFEDFYNGWEREEYNHTWESFWCLAWLKAVRFFSAFSWWGMLLAAPGIYFVLRSPRMRLVWIALALVVFGALVIVWSNAHYVAPASCVVVLLYIQALRYTNLLGRSRWRWGSMLARASVLLLFADTTLAVVRKQCDTFYWTCQGDISRSVILHKLEALPGKHLVMVRYSEDHNIHDDWVYNGADIDAQKVVWAREIDEEQDAKLFDYFRDRQVWLVTPDSDNTYLGPYSPPKEHEGKE